MHRLAAGALLLLTGCLRESLDLCSNGAYCPAPLVCTERVEAPFCGMPGEVGPCAGKNDEDACTLESSATGYCNKGLCTACDPNLSFCRYTSWTPMPVVIDQVPLTAELTGVWAAGPTDVYAVGKPGAVIHWDGRAWSKLPTVRSDADYVALWGFSGSELYAVTGTPINATRVFRFDGAAWQPQLPAPANLVNAIWGSGGRVVTVGQGGEVGSFNGSWMYTTPVAFALNAVWGSDANNMVAVGNGGNAARYTGAWVSDPTGTTAVLLDVASANSIEFAVGRVDAATKLPAVLRHAGNTWTNMTSMLPTADLGMVNLLGVWVTSPTDVIVVGDAGTIVRYDGTSWTKDASGVSTNINEIFGTNVEVFAVGAGGTVLRLSR